MVMVSAWDAPLLSWCGTTHILHGGSVDQASPSTMLCHSLGKDSSRSSWLFMRSVIEWNLEQATHAVRCATLGKVSAFVMRTT